MKTTKLLSFHLIIILLFISCDFSSGSDEIDPHHSFEAVILDQHGDTLSFITHDASTENLSANGIAVYGNDFLPDIIKESLAENSGLSPDDFLQNEIYLYAGSDLSDTDRHAMFRFTFANSDTFVPNRFNFMNFKEDYFIKNLKRLWNLIQQNPQNLASSKYFNEANIFGEPGDYANFEFRQNGFMSDIIFDNRLTEEVHLQLTSSGFIEITRVDESQLSGIFEANLLAVSGEILFKDEFPENIQFEKYAVKGSFTAKSGDLEDLTKIANHLPFNFPAAI